MKKVSAVLLAGVFGATALCALAGCASEPVTFDEEAPAYTDAAATLTVDGKVNKKDETRRISDSLFGVFLEDINYAGYALTDDLVVNGSFEAITKSKSYGWERTKSTFTVENTDGIFKNNTAYAAKNVNPNYAKIVAQAGGGIYNQGYDAMPMAVKAGTNYVFSAFVKSAAAVKMTVEIRSGTKVCAKQEIDLVADSDWVKYTRTFAADETESENVRLYITFEQAATVYLDGVSLKTTDSTVGIKNYIYEAVEQLSPKFIRFPGGCIIEGNYDQGENCAYDWKNSVGAVVNGTNAGDDTVPAFTYKVNTDGTVKEGAATYGEAVTRTHNPDLWAGSSYYDLDYSLGFFEYFKLCESVGASAIPILNCGLSCQGGVPAQKGQLLKGRHEKGVNDYIQDAKDLIAFAKGSVNSKDANERKWAQIRTDMGHPAPFKMDYVGIGNEQFDTAYYRTCYEEFIKAFAQEDENSVYRSVKLIVGNAMHFVDCEKPLLKIQGKAQAAAEACMKRGVIDRVDDFGVHDHHYYMNYTDFFTNAKLYDDYKSPLDDYTRGYEVFVGEYSANESKSNTGGVFGFDGDAWRNSWITALSEAAMMTGFERNGDVVKLAAYAPMFAQWNQDKIGRNWQVNMMYYTNTELVRSTNYYVQQLFMKNQGAYRLDSEIAFADGFEATYSLTGAGAAATIDKIYYVTSKAENGDVIVKIVNASSDEIKVNVSLRNVKAKGNATVTELQNNSYKAVNALGDTQISPATRVIGGWEKNALGYTAKPYSVTAIRIHAK